MSILQTGFADSDGILTNRVVGGATVRNWLSPHGGGALSSNVGAADLAFQRWFRFKEAYSPLLVQEALRENTRPVRRCIDPTGGSGTTALVCSMMGIDCDTIEVNPFMADIIVAKTTTYDTRLLAADITKVLMARPDGVEAIVPKSMPSTLIEPGENGRWVFNGSVASQILAFSAAIAHADPANRPFLRVMLGSVLRSVSNVVVNGKGRKYRRGWERRVTNATHVTEAMSDACNSALSDVVRFSGRMQGVVKVLEGDARTSIPALEPADCAIFSPPYPNSFDYTDIYNLELWMLGYLRDATDNRALRLATMHSHVQLQRPGRKPAGASPTLDAAMEMVEARKSMLWNRGIPTMLESYFADMEGVVADLSDRMHAGGLITIIVGGSSYAGVSIDAPRIIAELGQSRGLTLVRHSPLRSMRLSAQQGGQLGLSEDAVVLVC
jgi:hypothetical protein